MFFQSSAKILFPQRFRNLFFPVPDIIPFLPAPITGVLIHKKLESRIVRYYGIESAPLGKFRDLQFRVGTEKGNGMLHPVIVHELPEITSSKTSYGPGNILFIAIYLLGKVIYTEGAVEIWHVLFKIIKVLFLKYVECRCSLCLEIKEIL